MIMWITDSFLNSDSESYKESQNKSEESLEDYGQFHFWYIKFSLFFR